MKLSEPGGKKKKKIEPERQNSWLQVKQSKLYSDLLTSCKIILLLEPLILL